ncbi:MAG: TlpA family protein disulfide reductase [Azovibrio sp.]|nr:TlpA family protein disulfide reductase [Azovibrio sp.]
MKALKILALLLLAGAGLFAGMAFQNRASPPPTAPAKLDADALHRLLALRLPDTQGQEIALAQWSGKVLVVNFWATWCPPCQAEMPAFSRLHEAWQAQNVQFVGIAVDSAENVRKFAAHTPVSYPLLIGGNGIAEHMRALGNPAMGLPFTLVLRADGKLQASQLGGLRETELDALLKAASATAGQP